MESAFGFGSFARVAKEKAKQNNTTKCPTCKVNLQINTNNSQKLCPECSYVEEGSTTTGEGTKSRQCIVNARNITLFSSNADTLENQYNQKLKYYMKLFSQTPQYRIQKDLIEITTCYLVDIENNEAVTRWKDDNRDSLFGACLYHKALEHPAGIIWEKREIANALGLKKEGTGKGDKKLLMLVHYGKIKLNINEDTLPKYIHRYVELFNIDQKYEEFLQKLAMRTREAHVAFNSYNKSRAVGVIYWFVIKMKLSYSPKEIASKCFITKPTFDRVRKAIIKFPNIIGEEYLKIPEIKKE